MLSSGQITISGLTIQNGALTVGSFGAGIYSRGNLTITDSTVSGNTAEGNAGGTGGGIEAASGTNTLTSTIVSNNTSGTSTPDDIALNGGSIGASSSFNLIGDATTSGGLTDGTNNNIVGQDPLLAALASSGGTTQTHALMAGSPAIDAGAAFSALTTDQRGGLFTREDNGTADIGTYEQQVLAIVGGYLTAWLTPTNIINYAGYDSAGALVRIHWRPGDPVWNTDTLTDFVTDNQTRPTGVLSAYVSAAGTVNVVAADSNANIVRLWSADGESDTFSLDNLSDLAVRI